MKLHELENNKIVEEIAAETNLTSAKLYNHIRLALQLYQLSGEPCRTGAHGILMEAIDTKHFDT